MKAKLTKDWYKPREIARLGLIKNSIQSDNEDSNYWFILKMIERGELKARNYSMGAKPMWLVSRKEIEKYLRRYEV